MSPQALYRKWRPQTFDEVIGQEHVTHTLKNALPSGRISHAYLFAGPRGTGKTSMGRLLAKAVNCLSTEDNKPCNQCRICQAINEGRMLDLIEIDAASNRGIDEVRGIREKVGFRPNEARYKVYILDEAHMLTEPAFNALLKTLEEPPPHVIFVLVTTEPDKIPSTIRSRCQRFDFRRIPLQDMINHLSYIAQEEGLIVEPAALELIARSATGSLRDAESLLDQLMSYSDGKITLVSPAQITPETLGEMKKQAGRLPTEELVRAVKLFHQAELDLKASSQSQLPMELAFIEATFGEEPSSPTTRPPSRSVAKTHTRPAEVAPSRSAMDDEPRPPVKQKTEKEVQAASAGPELTLDTINSQWNRILQEVRLRNRSVEALLKSCRPLSVEGRGIVLGFYYPFHKEKVEEPQNKALVESVVSQVVNSTCHIRCVLSPKAESQAQRTPEPPKKMREGTGEVSKDKYSSIADDPLVQEAISKYGAQVVSIHE